MKKLSLLFAMLVAFSVTSFAAKRTVYFENTGNWNDIAVWVWADGTNYTGGTWPGAKIVSGGNALGSQCTVTKDGTTSVFSGVTCEKENDLYKVSVEVGSAGDNLLIIFNNNNNGSQTGDLKMVEGREYTASSTNDDFETSGFQRFYLRGEISGDEWPATEDYAFQTDDGKNYSLSVNALYGEFKIADGTWGNDYGDANVTGTGFTTAKYNSGNKNIVVAEGYQVKNATITFSWTKGDASITLNISGTWAKIDEGTETPGISGTLPVMYITTDKEMLNKDYLLKTTFDATYKIEIPERCDWDPSYATGELSGTIKLRGNYTRSGFSKKPYKIKLAKTEEKQALLGLSKSRDFALLAHADDDKGFMRNFVGFELGKLIGLPWTPSQQPVEVVINGEYRGLYFLTESIKVDKNRVNITEIEDNEADATKLSGGYLVELDNYEEDSSKQIQMQEKTCVGGHNVGKLLVTFDTPEELSATARRFLTEQFTKMNDLVGANSDDLWKYIDLDDAVRYYLVMELISHWEAYHGSTYMFRDFGEKQKWHFSPIWDCGNAFGASPNDFFYNQDQFGNTWIPSFRANAKFNAKLEETWKWFLNNGYNEIMAKIGKYAEQIDEASKADAKRWGDKNDKPSPGTDPVNGNAIDPTAVKVNNGVMTQASAVKQHLADKVAWLKNQPHFGSFEEYTGGEPQRDSVEDAAPLPYYVKPTNEGGDEPVEPTEPTAEYYIYFENTSNWTPYVHAWNDDETCTVAGMNAAPGETGWPGDKMTDLGNNLWYWEAPQGKVPTMVIISNNGDTKAGDNDLEFVNGATYKPDGSCTKPGPVEPTEPADEFTIYYDNSTTKWSQVNIHYWDEPKTSWPGVAMTELIEENIWAYTFKEDISKLTGVLFCNADGSQQTNDYFTKLVNGNLYKGSGHKQDVTSSGKYTGSTEPVPPATISGTLPVMYITTDDKLLDKDFLEKTEFKGSTVQIVIPEGCTWGTEFATDSLGASIKLRGNYTRSGFSKKPYKIKLDSKASLMGLSKSKHFALIAHADDNEGFMRNFVGFELGKLIGLPWTPSQQPVEVVINGEYRGLYFLTESIKVDKNRVNITELEDEVSDNALISGGYIVELDNYENDAVVKLDEKPRGNYGDAKVWVTPDTPEIYSDIQLRFITEQFTTINNEIGKIGSNHNLWSYLDLDDAVRYYLVRELCDDYEAYHGSTYLHRDHGEGQKWHFSPIWDCGSAFRRSNNKQFLYENKGDDEVYGNTWIHTLVKDSQFDTKLKETWKWFMNNGYKEIEAKINEYASLIDAAAKADAKKWAGYPLVDKTKNGGKDPVNGNALKPTKVKVNTDVLGKAKDVKSRLKSKIEFLSGAWGSYEGYQGTEPPARDDTKAAKLPEWASPDYVAPEPTYIYVYDKANWNTNGATPIYAYIHDKDKNQYAAWKGTEMTYEAELKYNNGEEEYTGLYVMKVPDGWQEKGMVIINNGSSQYPGSNKDGVSLNGKNIIYITGEDSMTLLDDPIVVKKPWSGTLPVLFIDTTDGVEIPADKSKVTGTYRMLEVNGTETTAATLEIKGRGTTTWTEYPKKPYKLKLDKKATLSGPNKSKHFVLLPYVADASNGLLSNVVGHELSRRAGMNWTPTETPVELVINNDYKGLYFIVENVRPASERVKIGDYSDWNDPTKEYDFENDWLVEIDNEASDDDTRYSWAVDGKTFRVVPSNPDFTEIAAEHEELLQGHLDSHFDGIVAALNEAANNKMSKKWMDTFDADQAVTYFMIQEIMDDANAWEKSMFMHHTVGSKWILGPVWDFAEAFASSKEDGGEKSSLLHDASANSAIASQLYANAWFRDMVIEKFIAFTGLDTKTEVAMLAYSEPTAAPINGIDDYITDYAAKIAKAAEADAVIWPDYAATSADNDINDRAINVSEKLKRNVTYLSTVWNSGTTGVDDITVDSAGENAETEYFDMMGRRIANPSAGNIYIVRKGSKVTKQVIK